jgi:C4-dicarboxylate-specific signal transduction histidine kinase
VRDQGIGIKGDIEKLGHMFTQLEIKDNVNQNGIGFGLSISKMIIEKIGGSLSIKTNCPSSASD